MTDYCVNDIDAAIRDNARAAARYGWTVEWYHDGFCRERRNPMSEPSLIPAIDAGRIMDAMRLAYRADCAATCGQCCYHPHPLLRIGQHSFAKLCTVAWLKCISDYYGGR